MNKILIADDHEEIRELLKVTLEDENYEIHFSPNAKKAIEIARGIEPDIIIMDIMMPGSINGLQATKIIKAEPYGNRSKIIILSAKGKDRDKIKAIEAGASAFIEKPFNPIHLIQKIKSLI